MLKRHSYIGKVNGVHGIWCDIKPENIELEKDILFYSADDGKVFVDKEGNFYDSVVIQDGVDINDYMEIKDPTNQEEPKEEANDSEENQND